MRYVQVHRVESGVYQVSWMGRLHLGIVRRNDTDTFWSNYRWSIDGQPCELVAGGVGGKTKKRGGWRRCLSAAEYLASMNSSAIIAFECRQTAGVAEKLADIRTKRRGACVRQTSDV
jgi:hypothetical protein